MGIILHIKGKSACECIVTELWYNWRGHLLRQVCGLWMELCACMYKGPKANSSKRATYPFSKVTDLSRY